MFQSKLQLTVLLLGHMVDTFVGCLDIDSAMADIALRCVARTAVVLALRTAVVGIDLDKDLKREVNM